MEELVSAVKTLIRHISQTIRRIEKNILAGNSFNV